MAETAVTNPQGALGSPVKLGQVIHRFVAGGTVPAKVAVTIADTGVTVAGVSAPVIGVSATGATAAGQVVDVVVSGEALVTASGTVTAGTSVIVGDAAGTVETDEAATAATLGVALEDGKAADDVRIWVAIS